MRANTSSISGEIKDAQGGVLPGATVTATHIASGIVVERGSTTAVLDDPQEEYTRLLRASVPHAGWRPQRRTTTTTMGIN